MSRPVTAEWLLELGFLPDGETADNGDLAKRIWSVDEETSWGEFPAMQIVWSPIDGSTWLDTYDMNGISLCLVELPYKATEEDMLALCLALGVGE